MKILLDTNIVLDVLDQTRSNAELTEIMFNGLSKHDIKYCCSMDALSTITHIMRVKGERATEIIKAVLGEFECLGLMADDAIRANEILDANIIKDYEDAQMISTAIRSECVTLITNDKELLRAVGIKEIEIVSPETILLGLGYKKDLLDNWINENSDEFKISQMTEKESEDQLLAETLGEIEMEFNFMERLKQHYKDLRSGKAELKGVTREGRRETLFDFATDEQKKEFLKNKK